MSYAVERIDDIPELDDGRCPMRPVRHHFGITGFGATAWTARNAGDRIINEHQEAETDVENADEELYVVVEGRATFELSLTIVDQGRFVMIEAIVNGVRCRLLLTPQQLATLAGRFGAGAAGRGLVGHRGNSLSVLTPEDGRVKRAPAAGLLARGSQLLPVLPRAAARVLGLGASG